MGWVQIDPFVSMVKTTAIKGARGKEQTHVLIRSSVGVATVQRVAKGEGGFWYAPHAPIDRSMNQSIGLSVCARTWQYLSPYSFK